LKILHLAAGNRWTGAAAPAFAEVEALRAAGIEAHYAYVGGYKLQAKLADVNFAHPLIEKAQNPVSFVRTARAIERFIAAHEIDTLHAHLTYDHWLARFIAADRPVRVVRTFHSRRVLRRDPLTRSILKRTDGVAIVNATFAQTPLLASREVAFTPPPLDRRLFAPQGPDARAVYGVGADETLITVIGKLSAGRGFEDALRTFSHVHRARPDVRLMIIGHGEHRPVLERLASDLLIAPAVIWAGYHETDLAEHYRAADALLFTAAGSDEGHRAVLEAMACGVVPVTFPIAGVDALLGPLAADLIAPAPSAEALALKVQDVLGVDHLAFGTAVTRRVSNFDYAAAATRLIALYSDLHFCN
jgi:glycosyltransferase involved in cell wall biosynthesis